MLSESSMERLSPLSLLTERQSLTRLIARLQKATEEILRSQEARAVTGLAMSPHPPYLLSFCPGELAEARRDFTEFILQGEARLHGLAHLLSRSLFGTRFELTSTVIGEVPDSTEPAPTLAARNPHARFTLSLPLTVEQLLASSDLELGKRQLARHGVLSSDGTRWLQPHLVANFVEYEPREGNAFKVTKLLSRIKAEQELWNKVTDEIFDLDRLFARDKQLRKLSRYVKDVFGIKILTEDTESARALHSHLTTWRWTDNDLSQLNLPGRPGDDRSLRQMEFLEIKDYLSQGAGKNSGWTAIKSVVRWWDQTFELQIQPLPNYYREQERFTRESHQSFKLSRERFREDVARRLPLYGFIRDVLRWLFSAEPHGPRPTFPGVAILLQDEPIISASGPRGTENESVKMYPS
jgi:hypothetical protein